MTKKIIAFVGVLALGVSSAHAGVMIEVIQLATPPFSAPDAALTGFTSYQVNAVTTAGELISAVDVNFTGTFHQRWADLDFGGVADDPSPVGQASNTRGDSHLTLVAGALIGSAPSEDNSLSGSPLPITSTAGYGLGTFMRGAWGIPGASQTTSATLGLSVQPIGSMNLLSYSIATNQGTFTGEAVVGIPEPSTFALAGLSLIGLVMRRRNG